MEIDRTGFVSFFTYGSDCDPYGFLRQAIERGEVKSEDVYVDGMLPQIGRIWWVFDPDDGGFPVTAEDFLKSQPEVSWNEIYAREEQWSRDSDPFHGMFR